MTTTAKALYQTVSSLGLTRSQVRRLLPTWWSADAERSPDAAAELAMLLSRRLSIDVADLLAGRVTPKGAVRQVAFKHQARLDRTSLTGASHIASSLAHTIIAATPLPYRSLSPNPATLQKDARALAGGLLNFQALVSLCWHNGIPVIPLPNLPVGVRKMDGAALQSGERPAIVIARRKSSRAWLSFILAHEMAHILLGHVSSGSSIIDVSLQDMATYATESAQDRQESQADEVALQILGGEAADLAVASWRSSWSPVEIAAAARVAASEQHVDAGHLVLRHAFTSKRWPEAVTALRFLQEDLDPEQELVDQLKKNVILDSIAEDLQDLVLQITGWAEVG
jgi:hypothetical protein